VKSICDALAVCSEVHPQERFSLSVIDDTELAILTRATDQTLSLTILGLEHILELMNPSECPRAVIAPNR